MDHSLCVVCAMKTRHAKSVRRKNSEARVKTERIEVEANHFEVYLLRWVRFILWDNTLLARQRL